MSQLFSKIPQFFLAPENLTGTSTGVPSTGGKGVGQPTVNQPTNKEDVIEFLGEENESADVIDISEGKGKRDKADKSGKDTSEKEDETPDETDDTSDDEESESDSDELEELEQELEGPTDEQLELVTPVRRKEILTKYPNLFKDFPYLERAYYREQAFTEVVPTIEDAKTAVAKAETLDRFENELMGGTTENILKAVKEENPDGFYKIVDDYLPTLAKVDEKAYFHVLGNLTKHTIGAMVIEARRSNNEALQSAAAILNQFVFGTTDYKPPTNLAKDTPEKAETDKKVTEREREFVQRQFESVNTDLGTRVNNTLKNTIDAHIDPKSTMSDYVKRNASKDALEQLEGLMSRDSRFKSLTDKLWEAAFKDNFSKVAVDRIRSAYLSKAKTLLPSVIKKARNEALRGTGHRVRNDDAQETPEVQTRNKGPVPAGRPRTSNPGKIKSASDIPKGMRTIDFLMQD
jgi:hypothetical protein